MHHAEENIPRLVILRLDIVFHRLGERLVAGLVALHDLAALLIDDDNMIVFVNRLHYMFIPPSTWIT